MEIYFQIIKRYNWPHRPVRIFTYLIAGASSSRESMQGIACSNKGQLNFRFIFRCYSFWAKNNNC